MSELEVNEFWALEVWRQKMDGGYWERDEERWSSQYNVIKYALPPNPSQQYRIVHIIEVVQVEVTT